MIHKVVLAKREWIVSLSLRLSQVYEHSLQLMERLKVFTIIWTGWVSLVDLRLQYHRASLQDIKKAFSTLLSKFQLGKVIN